MKLLKLLITIAIVVAPSFSKAEIPLGLWEVLSYPKTVATTSNAPNKVERSLLPVDSKNRVPYFGQKQTKESTYTDPVSLPDGTVIMHICFKDDGTWYELDYGSEKGRWTRIGDQISLSGNDPSYVANAGSLSIVQPDVSMSGTLQFWTFIDPQGNQEVYSSSWTLKDTICPETTN